MHDPNNAESLPEKVERLSAECVALSHQLIDVTKERNKIELAYLDAERQLVEVKGKEKLIRTALSSANRDLISSQSLMKAVHR